eukprot:TRINITY_DN583_c0_g1_i1.p1 TRINITY_DN583_c0_g1~~TRINITY_DN583_c0_g1_i1.p1  ORF type:complete len:350 (+),score=167.73 TRINITY_DN583_c0_g1_i1:57-1106(+)
MAADPKYAGLPGIAVDQPDMYETVEGGERDEQEDSSTSTEEGETLHLTSLSWLGDMEVGAGPGTKETIVQKFARLRCEVGELAEELDSLTESVRESGHMDGLNMQVRNLSRQLESCQVEGTEGGSSDSKVTVEMLSKQIQDMQGGTQDKKDSAGGVYELYLATGEKVSLDISTVDGRLAALEKVVGKEGVGDRKVLSAETDGQTMARAVDTLASRKNFLQQQHVDHVEGRLAALTYKMNAIGEQKAAVEMANKEDKVTRLVGMVASQASLASVLPDLLDRMELVGGVQEGAKQWVLVLDSAEQQQRETNKLLEDTDKMVKETRECFDTNLNSVADKFAELQKRLQEIQV